MGIRKMTIVSFALGALVGGYLVRMPNSLDCKLHYLRRKINCARRKMERVIKNMNGENVEKFTKEITGEFEKIKDKIENLTIKDIKDKSSEVFNNALTSLNDFKEKLLTY